MVLVKAIEREPTKAEYHLYYGLKLLNTLPSNRFSAQNQMCLARKEFINAAKLKSYSELYQKASDTYVTWIDKQLW